MHHHHQRPRSEVCTRRWRRRRRRRRRRRTIGAALYGFLYHDLERLLLGPLALDPPDSFTPAGAIIIFLSNLLHCTYEGERNRSSWLLRYIDYTKLHSRGRGFPMALLGTDECMYFRGQTSNNLFLPLTNLIGGYTLDSVQ